jgi:DNA phosphorothioation-associated DGQHR protein 1
MTSRANFPYTVHALRVEQPLGVFYIASLPASLLLDVTFSDTLRAEYSEGEQAYRLDGTQRLQQAKRLDAIASYIERTDASFPNAIILAANSRPEQKDEDSADADTNDLDDLDWVIEEGEDGLCELTIPSSAKMAAIIDGQHRLFAFAKAADRLLDMQLVCSIFLDIPKPFQAQLFATINSTQKPVDRSLTYELFGYNILDEEPPFWTPDKLAVFLTRKLGTEEESPLKGRIVIAPKKDRILEALTAGGGWRVSTAVVVDGIMKLYSSNPKRDTTNMLQGESHPRSYISTLRKDKSPLRELYLSGNDAVIHQIVLNFLKACDSTFWIKASPRSFIKKTVGVQALFDVLRKIIPMVLEKKNLKVATFETILLPASEIDFSDTEFQNASGSGRSLIARTIKRAIGFEN